MNQVASQNHRFSPGHIRAPIFVNPNDTDMATMEADAEDSTGAGISTRTNAPQCAPHVPGMEPMATDVVITTMHVLGSSGNSYQHGAMPVSNTRNDDGARAGSVVEQESG